MAFFEGRSEVYIRVKAKLYLGKASLKTVNMGQGIKRPGVSRRYSAIYLPTIFLKVPLLIAF